MIPLPKWAEPLLKDKKCPFCEESYLLEWICGLGVREVGMIGTKDINNQAGMSVEYCCQKCGRISQTIIHSNDPNLCIRSMDIAREILYSICDAYIKENPIDIEKIIDGLKEIYPNINFEQDDSSEKEIDYNSKSEIEKNIHELLDNYIDNDNNNIIKKIEDNNKNNEDNSFLTEIDEFIKKLPGMNHEDFMRYIGVPDSEIKKYSNKPRNDNDKDK